MAEELSMSSYPLIFSCYRPLVKPTNIDYIVISTIKPPIKLTIKNGNPIFVCSISILDRYFH